jgi:hypothetical protein
MRLIKLAGLSIFFLFLVVTIISFFIPGKVKISKATNVAAGDTSIFKNIDDLREWKHWHPAFKEVPENEMVLSRDSIRVKNTLISVVERKNDELQTEIIAPGNRPMSNDLRLIHHINSDSATLQWYMQFDLPWYPWEKFKSLFYENFYGVQMEQGLANLKKISESAARQ